VRYFISDTHFGHQSTIGFGRPFSDVDQMDAAIISKWNETVREDDTVYILGDFWYKGVKPVSWYASQLVGKKVLIPGNHDAYWMSRQPEALRFFEKVSPYMEITEERPSFILCHYPMLDWNGQRRGRFMIHGHTHSTDYLSKSDRLFATLKDMPNILNACVEINNYTPVTLEQLISNNNVFYQT
jgi:calcineurin-like phosphoesterase family protein